MLMTYRHATHTHILSAKNLTLPPTTKQEIGKLEAYIEESQCILIFLSKSYFFSKNCLRELDHALKLDKPLILVHETDLERGGAELETLIADCRSKDRGVLFDNNKDILQWQRVHDFQLDTLKRICARILHAGQKDFEEDPPDLYIPSEVSCKQLTFEKEVMCYTSKYNLGASAIGEELLNAMRSTKLRFTSIPPDAFKGDVTAHDSLSGEREGSLPDSTSMPRRELKRGLTQTLTTQATLSARNLLNRAVTGLTGQTRRVTHVRTLSERTRLSLSLSYHAFDACASHTDAPRTDVALPQRGYVQE